MHAGLKVCIGNLENPVCKTLTHVADSLLWTEGSAPSGTSRKIVKALESDGLGSTP